MKKFPFISIIIPTLNEEKTIKKCLKSIKELEYPKKKYEVIVVDNNSEDRTVEFAKEFNVKLMKNPIHNISKSRNLGASETKGTILAFVDADCIVHNSWLRNAISKLEPIEAGAVGSLANMPTNSTFIQKIWFNHIKYTFNSVNYIPSANFIIKKRIFNSIGGFDESLETGEDCDISERIKKAGYKIIIDPKIKAVHLGYPKTIGEFFKEEWWHSKSMIKEIKKNGLKFDHAFIFALFYLFCYFIAIFSVIFNSFLLLFAVIGTLLITTFILALRTTISIKQIK
ncbi:glycosyltransferase, partial [Candidatus Woesearchaeota archaeon]|nr:glycosyltransferase [Candidatus Woesearchaeota archaeon]